MNRAKFDAGMRYIGSRFGQAVKADTVTAVFEELDGRGVTDDGLVSACKRIVEEEDSLPRNLTRAILSRCVLQASQFTVDDYNRDTRRPFTVEEMNANLRRLCALTEIATDKDHPRRSSLLACAVASSRGGDTAEALTKWGGHIVELLDTEIAGGRRA